MSWLTYLPLYLLVAVVGNIKKKGEVWAAYEITGTQEQSHATNYRRIRHEHAHRGTVASVHAFLDMYTRAHGCSPDYLPNRFVLFKVFVCTFATSKKVAMLGSKGRSAAIKRIMSPVYTVRKGATKVWKWFKVYLMVAKKRWGTVRKSDSLTSFLFFSMFLGLFLLWWRCCADDKSSLQLTSVRMHVICTVTDCRSSRKKKKHLLHESESRNRAKFWCDKEWQKRKVISKLDILKKI